MPSLPFALVAVTMVAVWSSKFAPSTSSRALVCDSVGLSSQSSTKWIVRCTNEATARVSLAWFNPSRVQTFVVTNQSFVASSSSFFDLSSTFSSIATLVSTSMTHFSLSAASGFHPNVPIHMTSTAFAQLSTLRILHLEALALVNTSLHLVLPSSIQQISIINCSLRNLSFEFTDGSTIGTSSLSFIDLRFNDLTHVPAFLYAIPPTISTVDLRGNDHLTFANETLSQLTQLSTWINGNVLKVPDAVLATYSYLQTIAPRAFVKPTKVKFDSILSTPSPDNDKSIPSTGMDSEKNPLPVTVIAVMIPVMLMVVVLLAFVIQKRLALPDRDADAILDLPRSFRTQKQRDVSKTSSDSTLPDGEFSRSHLFDDSYVYDERNSCVMLEVTPLNATNLQLRTSSGASYVNLNSPEKLEPIDTQAATKRLQDHHKDSLDLEVAPRFPARDTARQKLGAALELLVHATSSRSLTINDHDYSFSPGTSVQETPLAFLIDCQRSEKEPTSVLASFSKLVLKVFIEEDAALAERESSALSCLQSRTFAPRLQDMALVYRLRVDTFSKDADDIKCSILVLEMPSNFSPLSACIGGSSDPVSQQIYRLVTAIGAFHATGFVHNALHPDSLVVCSDDDRQFKFWGLEYVTKAGDGLSCPDFDLVGGSQAEFIAPELALKILEGASTIRSSFSGDIWSFGVLVLKIYASGRPLEEFQTCSQPRDVFNRLVASLHTLKRSRACFFERSIAQFVENDDMKAILSQCFQYNEPSRPSLDWILKHQFFSQAMECNVSLPMLVKKGSVYRKLSAIIEKKTLAIARGSTIVSSGGDQEGQVSDRDQLCDQPFRDQVPPEPQPPSLCLFLAPVELQVELTSPFDSVDDWMAHLEHLQQQQVEEVRFPLIFMCESHVSNPATPCTLVSTTDYGVNVSLSLLPLVMPLVRETMLFLQARAIVSNGSCMGGDSGLRLAIPQQWHELQTFYRALERMDLASVNPVNELELAPMEQQLNERDPVTAQLVLEKLSRLIFSNDKREYVRNLLNALINDEEELECHTERGSWASLHCCHANPSKAATPSGTRWLCSHHAAHHNKMYS